MSRISSSLTVQCAREGDEESCEVSETQGLGRGLFHDQSGGICEECKKIM